MIQGLDDNDFEFMLKVMKMIQTEQDIRARTRALGATPPDPASPGRCQGSTSRSTLMTSKRSLSRNHKLTPTMKMKPQIYLMPSVAPFAIGNLIPSALAQKDEEAPPKPEGPAIELPENQVPRSPVTEDQKKSIAANHTRGLPETWPGEQDELSADVQDLIEEQTNEKVISPA